VVRVQMRPTVVNILGVDYRIEYVDNPAEVDIFRRTSLWGQVDYWTRTIRIYANNRPEADIWETLIHEVLHAISESLHIKINGNKLDDTGDAIDLIALGLTDVLFRNDWIRREA
jgi:hypothetical protein